MFTSAIKKLTSDCSFYFIKSLYGISNLEIWNHRKKESNSIVLVYIADVSVSTNLSYIELV